jgi:hypothetical protein
MRRVDPTRTAPDMRWVAAVGGPGSENACMINGDRPKLGPNAGRRPRDQFCVRSVLLRNTEGLLGAP